MTNGLKHSSDNLLLAYDPLSYAKDLSPDLRDNSSTVPKSIVVDAYLANPRSTVLLVGKSR